MAKKKMVKAGNKKSGARKSAPPAKSSGTPAPLDPVQQALARRRAALLRR